MQVSWGRLENFKCVDYFQIEYYEKDDMVKLHITALNLEVFLNEIYFQSGSPTVTFMGG